MKYYLFYENNKIIGYANCKNICTNFKCREVTKDEYDDYQNVLEAKKKIADKLNELTNWFNATYRYKIEKYTRLIALEKPDDDGISAETKLKKLYEEAEEKRYKIQELEKN